MSLFYFAKDIIPYPNLQVRTTKASRLFRDFLLEWIHKKNPTS